MLISLEYLVNKYNIKFTGILHVGMHEAEEIESYEKYISRNKILWIEAISNKVEYCLSKFPSILVENAIISDVEGEDVTFHISNNGQSSSILELGLHKFFHPDVHYINSFKSQSKRLDNLLSKYSDISFNFLNLDIQGVELRALKSLGNYLEKVDYIYTEVNSDYVYEKCDLIGDIDSYLELFRFKRVETSWSGNKWGDAFYVKY
jgi:FkbM family methyltransferase